MVVPMEDHRSARFPELSLACIAGLKQIFRTATGLPIMFPSSGTGCWEAALTNCLNPGDRVLAARFGQFSHLWIDMCQRLGFDVEVIEEEWGTGASPERYLAALEADKSRRIKAVLVCQNETATGVRSDVRAIRAALDAAKHPALLFVDSVSALGSMDFRMDDWRVDVCVSGSQKGLMLPAGMGITCVSERAMEAAKAATSRRCYFDYNDMVQVSRTGYFPYTPSIPMLYGLKESLAIIFEEGLPASVPPSSPDGSSSSVRVRKNGTRMPSPRSCSRPHSMAPKSSPTHSSATTSRSVPDSRASPASFFASVTSAT
jgi:alanine-glyoxylate transaminase/serine-glyoxylate transaminase/serine-pyruvate transaminase